MKQHDFGPLVLRYLFGLGAALCLSVLAYLFVVEQWLDSSWTMAVLLLLATTQLVIQLICFLHLGFRDRSRNRTMTFIFVMVMSVIIIVGSLWVMKNLDYRMSTSGDAMNEYMEAQNKKGF